MGTQTNAHIAAVNLELTNLKNALAQVKTTSDQFTATWHSMMTAHDKPGGGKAASSAFGNTLKTEATNHDTAITHAQTAYHNAQAAITNMDNFVVQKDNSTINPLKKKSIKKAKQFVIDAKAALAGDAGILTKTGLTGPYNSCKGIYY